MRSEDKLPALSGLAQAFADVSGYQYVAGLWRESHVGELLWQIKIPTKSHRSTGYGAPLWSWASLDGEIRFKWFLPSYYGACSSGQNSGYVTLEDVKVDIELAERNPYGRILAAKLSV
jgi:hypothetical protein